MPISTEKSGDRHRGDLLIVKPTSLKYSRDVKCLTSLRFFAAAWVVLLHFSHELPMAVTDLTQFFENGRLGVDFFFVLSGFILSHVYLTSLEEDRFSFRRFIQKRLARLYPLHLVCILLVAGYIGAGALVGVSVSNPEVYSLDRLGYNLLLMHAWGVVDGMSWNYVSWSISAEWFAYLLFLPMSMLFVRWQVRSSLKLLGAMAFLVFMVVASPSVFGRDLTQLTHDFGNMRILPEFILGIALYHFSNDHDVDAVLGPWLLALAVIALAAIAHYDLNGFWAVVLLAFIIFASSSLERQGKLGFLGNRVLVYLGETSYSLYMLHAIVFIVYFKSLDVVFGDQLRSVIWYLAPLVIPLSFAAASVGYHVVEVPCRRWITERIDLDSVFRWPRSHTVPD